MQDVNMFAGADQCQLPEYGPYSYICKSVYLYTIIRVVRPSTSCVTLLGTLLKHHPLPEDQGHGLGSLQLLKYHYQMKVFDQKYHISPN